MLAKGEGIVTISTVGPSLRIETEYDRESGALRGWRVANAVTHQVTDMRVRARR